MLLFDQIYVSAATQTLGHLFPSLVNLMPSLSQVPSKSFGPFLGGTEKSMMMVSVPSFLPALTGRSNITPSLSSLPAHLPRRRPSAHSSSMVISRYPSGWFGSEYFPTNTSPSVLSPTSTILDF